MNTSPQPETVELAPKKLPIDWAESDWFEVWLRLARRDYQGNPNAQQESPSWLSAAAA